jgi:hypothetical protein
VKLKRPESMMKWHLALRIYSNTIPKQSFQPYAGRMSSWVQSSITNLNKRKEKQNSRISDFREVRSEVKESDQGLEKVLKSFPWIPYASTVENP